MKSGEQPESSKRRIVPLPEKISPPPRIIFTDVDDTLTCDGVLPVETYNALYNLQQAGFVVIPVTGASAGWCDCLIKTWPIQHIIGENGALTMAKDECGVVSISLAKAPVAVERDLATLMQVGEELSSLYPSIGFTQDQNFRLTDIAFDIGQAVTVEAFLAEQATDWLRAQGVQARPSSIHINAWIGDYSKATGAVNWLNQRNLSTRDCLFIGDSPNDESMFMEFPLSVGVANIERFLDRMDQVPSYITKSRGGYGFVDMASVLLTS